MQFLCVRASVQRTSLKWGWLAIQTSDYHLSREIYMWRPANPDRLPLLVGTPASIGPGSCTELYSAWARFTAPNYLPCPCTTSSNWPPFMALRHAAWSVKLSRALWALHNSRILRYFLGLDSRTSLPTLCTGRNYIHPWLSHLSSYCDDWRLASLRLEVPRDLCVHDCLKIASKGHLQRHVFEQVLEHSWAGDVSRAIDQSDRVWDMSAPGSRDLKNARRHGTS